ncbi:MAG TPA: hypothetical protein VMU41_00185 [Candidatus Binataceae bacterium]|nr:hypothetical protein [Candidatus Binataceae bacterium]
MGNLHKSTVRARLALLGICLIAAACSSQAEPKRAANPNRYIYVTNQNLDEQCYHDLGPISLTEPYAQATVDSSDSTLANRLRAQAMKQYPEDADAVIGVHAEDNDAGTAETVSGEAVEVVNKTTAICALREIPPKVDTAATAAAGGMLGALTAGLISGQPEGAEGGGYLGAAAAGSYEIMTNRQNAEQKDQDLHDALAQQKQQILALQNERAQLNECMQEETPLAQCESSTIATGKPPAADKSDEPDWNASQFDLEKQIQMQQDYIAKLKDQVWTLQHQMQSQQQ